MFLAAINCVPIWPDTVALAKKPRKLAPVLTLKLLLIDVYGISVRGTKVGRVKEIEAGILKLLLSTLSPVAFITD